jgi:hypothetical protein
MIIEIVKPDLKAARLPRLAARGGDIDGEVMCQRVRNGVVHDEILPNQVVGLGSALPRVSTLPRWQLFYDMKRYKKLGFVQTCFHLGFLSTTRYDGGVADWKRHAAHVTAHRCEEDIS